VLHSITANTAPCNDAMSNLQVCYISPVSKQCSKNINTQCFILIL